MARIFSRQEIIDRLRETIRQGHPVIGAGAGAGIVGKCAELSGADLIIVSNIYEPWMLGFETRVVVGYTTDITVKMGREMAQVVKDTPLIAGLDASDPFNTHQQLLDLAAGLGFSGITNLPTVGAYGRDWRVFREGRVSVESEVEFLALAHRKGLFTMAYVYDGEDATAMAKAGVDCMVAHVGPTGGGMSGFPTKPIEECCRIVNEIIDATKKVDKDIICLAHGGAFIEAEDTKTLYARTNAVGVVGESSFGRIPIERAIVDVVRGFKSIPMKAKR